jgi:peptidyl-prolyl cis-trans isomerase D
MFDFIRNHNRLFFFVMVLLIFPSFAFFGIQGYTGMRDGVGTVAQVDGRKITQAEWDLAVRQQGEQLRQSIPDVDPKLLDSPEIKREALERLVRERVLFSAANRQHLIVTDEQVKREILQAPQFASLRGADGSIDIGAYKAMLSARGFTPEMFEASLRQDAMLRQVLRGPTDPVPASTMPARLALESFLQRRQVQIQTFDPKTYADKAKPTDEQLQDYYKRNEALLRTPEQAVIEYVTLDAQALKAAIVVSPDDVKARYDQNLATLYTKAEERQASHILFKAEASASSDVRAAAKKQAEAMLEQVRKSPDQFAALAKQHSQDPGSAAQGGDLGFFGRDAMVKPFENAAYAMKPGEISNVIESDFGYHIIRLTATRGGDKEPFESVRAKIEDELKLVKAQELYNKELDAFGNTAYEQADSLQPLVEKFKLAKQSTTVGRSPGPDAKGILASTKLVDAVFADDVLKNKRNTPAVETGKGQVTVARLVEHKPSLVRPFDQVRDQVRDAVAREQGLAQAKKDGEARLAMLQSGAPTTGLPEAVALSRVQTQGQTQEVVDAVMAAPSRPLPQVIGVDQGGLGYVVVRIVEVNAPPAESPEVKALAPRYAQAWAAAQSQAYYDALKGRLGAQVLVKDGGEKSLEAAGREPAK